MSADSKRLSAVTSLLGFLVQLNIREAVRQMLDGDTTHRFAPSQLHTLAFIHAYTSSRTAILPQTAR
ncbi:hypothetical protein BgiMline_002384 [Biomphalaria glabrata]|nr:hypothetical protein BgiMline_002260 [Biomphalaria glabrata]